jgi:hypothetical protein
MNIRDDNKRKVIENDKLESQVPGILLDKTGVEKPEELRNQELFYRAINR